MDKKRVFKAVLKNLTLDLIFFVLITLWVSAVVIFANVMDYRQTSGIAFSGALFLAAGHFLAYKTTRRIRFLSAAGTLILAGIFCLCMLCNHMYADACHCVREAFGIPYS